MKYRIDPPPRARIACGARHTMCAQPDGSVLGWGSDCFGQLGLGRETVRDSGGRSLAIVGAERLIKFEAVVHIAVGATHSVAVRASGDTFVSWALGMSKARGYRHGVWNFR